MDPLSLAVTITTIVTQALKISYSIKTRIDAIKEAPQHIKAIGSDLDDVYCILGTLGGYLDDSEMAMGLLQVAAKTNIESVLKNCLETFNRISGHVSSFTSNSTVGRITTWKKLKYTMDNSETAVLQRELAAHKLSLNMAISLLNFISINAVTDATQRIETDIATYLQELETKLPSIIADRFEATMTCALPPGKSPTLSDLSRIPRNYTFALNTYMKNIISASSIFSDKSTLSGPSMQVSSLVRSQGTRSESIYISIYETAYTHITPSKVASSIAAEEISSTGLGEVEAGADKVTDIWVRTLAGMHFRLEYRADLRVDEVKAWLTSLGEFPPQKQRIVARGKQLNEDRDLTYYGITPGDTLHMVPSIRGGDPEFLSRPTMNLYEGGERVESVHSTATAVTEYDTIRSESAATSITARSVSTATPVRSYSMITTMSKARRAAREDPLFSLPKGWSSMAFSPSAFRKKRSGLTGYI